MSLIRDAFGAPPLDRDGPAGHSWGRAGCPATPASRCWLGRLLLWAALAVVQDASAATRIKEVATVQGVRANQLVGYGLVVGLDGTGDQSSGAPFTAQSLAAMLQQMGVTVPPGVQMQPKNVAAVMVTAVLPAFAQPGQVIDVNVSSLGNAKSLRGGTLIATPLKGADGALYAMAQGNLIVGGAGAAAAGSKVVINHLSAGRVPQGATVERAVPTPLAQGEFLQLDLGSSDFATARDVARAINQAKGEGTAIALDGRVVRVRAPAAIDARVAFLADIENLSLELVKPAARIVLNARTGSVVMNDAVTLAACAVAHGCPVGDDQLVTGGQPAQRVRSGPDGRERACRHLHHRAKRCDRADAGRCQAG